MTEPRRTVAADTVVEGVGVHSGHRVAVTLRPAASGSGIVFRRVDLPGAPDIPARLSAVSDTDRRTSLGSGDATVGTVEHFLAVAAAHGIDDLLVEVSGPELPIGDGSALAFHEALTTTGMQDLEGTPAVYTSGAPLVVTEGDARYVVAPSSALRLTVTIEWDHPLIGRQSGCFDITRDVFARDLAGARTFGFEGEAEQLRATGLALGATPDNTVILGPKGLRGGDLRWPDEFVRHKTVDLLGDLALLGTRLKADITAFRPSHRGNVALARVLERTASREAPPVMGIQEILGVLPHRYPFLLVDRILEMEPAKRIVGIKNVTMNEPFFTGHFPDHPVMPGVLIVEAMAQTGGLLLLSALPNAHDKLVYFMSIDGVKFRKPVTPGDQLRAEIEVLRYGERINRMRAMAYVDGQVVAEAEMAAVVVNR